MPTPKKPPVTKEIMKAGEVAEYLGIATSTVYKKVEYRQIPFTKVGTLLRFPKWIIDQWMSENAVRPERSLFDEFAQLHQRYHLEQFLKAKGLNVKRLSEAQLLAELTAAVEQLKAEIAAAAAADPTHGHTDGDQ